MHVRTKVHSNSGVFPIAIYTKPSACGGDCLFCPREEGFPRSYVSNSDTLYAKDNLYSPTAQLERVIDKFSIGDTEHIFPSEIIVLGGSFSALDHCYRNDFMATIYDYLPIPFNQTAHNRLRVIRFTPSVVTVEARPDQITSEECKQLRRMGVSKVEIGVQHTSDAVLEFNNRGHNNSVTIRATRLLKDEGFKVGYHVMLGLPKATRYDDEKMLSSTLWDPEYFPDFLKVYPCILLNNPQLQPKLFKLFRQGAWRPITDAEVTTLLVTLAKAIPHQVRISRIQRQIENYRTVQGITDGVRGKIPINFPDLRSREIGRILPSAHLEHLGAIKERVTSNGDDIVFELVTQEEVCLGIVRLRIRSSSEVVIREIKVFGKPAAIGNPGLIQGKGLGKRLLRMSEIFARDFGANYLLANASFGARPFFQSQGFSENTVSMLTKLL